MSGSRQIKVSVAPSLYLSCLLFLMHVGALAILIFAEIPSWLFLLLAGLLLYSQFDALMRYAWLRMPESCMSLLFSEYASVEILTQGGVRHACKLQTGSLVLPFLAVLRLGSERRRFGWSVIILPDTIGQESFRRLRVWLKWKGQALQ